MCAVTAGAGHQLAVRSPLCGGPVTSGTRQHWDTQPRPHGGRCPTPGPEAEHPSLQLIAKLLSSLLFLQLD